MSGVVFAWFDSCSYIPLNHTDTDGFKGRHGGNWDISIPTFCDTERQQSVLNFFLSSTVLNFKHQSYHPHPPPTDVSFGFAETTRYQQERETERHREREKHNMFGKKCQTLVGVSSQLETSFHWVFCTTPADTGSQISVNLQREDFFLTQIQLASPVPALHCTLQTLGFSQLAQSTANLDCHTDVIVAKPFEPGRPGSKLQVIKQQTQWRQ